jgi:hypothetical protein
MALVILSRALFMLFGPELGITQPGMTIVCGDSHHLLMELSEQLLLVLEQVKWKWYWLRNACCKANQKQMRINIDGELTKVF